MSSGAYGTCALRLRSARRMVRAWARCARCCVIKKICSAVVVVLWCARARTRRLGGSVAERERGGQRRERRVAGHAGVV